MQRSKDDLPDYVTDRIGPHHSLKAVLAVDGALMLAALLVAMAVGSPGRELSLSTTKVMPADVHSHPLDDNTAKDAGAPTAYRVPNTSGYADYAAGNDLAGDDYRSNL